MAATSHSLANVLAETTDDETAALILQLVLENEKGGFQPLQEVLADTDEATATLILQLQIEDSQSNDHATLFPYEPDFRRAQASHGHELRRFQTQRPPNALRQQPTAAPVPEPVQAPPRVLRYSCNGACVESYTADGCIQGPCGDHYCHGCVNELFSLAIKDKSAYPPRCCRQIIPFEDVKDVLAPTLAKEFASKKPELDDPKPVYCHVPTCSTYVGEGDKQYNVGICPGCKKETCVLCKNANHSGDCEGNKALDETKKLADSQGWKQCPGCGRIVELGVGCNHMTCLCKSEFCYVCTALWKNCECPQFDDTRRWERAREIVERDGHGDVCAIAAGLRRHHECADNNHDYAFEHGGGNVCEMCNENMPVFILRCRRCHAQLCRRCRYNRT